MISSFVEYLEPRSFCRLSTQHRTEGIFSRLAHETPPCTLMSRGACKIRRGCNVLEVSIQNYTSRVTKLGIYLFRGWSVLWCHVSGPSLCMSPNAFPAALLFSDFKPNLPTFYSMFTVVSIWEETIFCYDEGPRCPRR